MENKNKFKTYSIHFILFLLTIVTTTIAGAECMFGKHLFFVLWGTDRVSVIRDLNYQQLLQGLAFSIPFVAILTVHEFGHYFTARFHKLKVSLPYYLPLWMGFLGLSTLFGTLGAFIRIRNRIKSRKEFFDVGISGPLAGFVLALGVLYYGFTHLPPPEYIFEIHPEYKEYGLDYAQYVYVNAEKKGDFKLGTNLLFEFFKNYVATDPSRIPNPYEMIHYPYLFAGYIALFFTALNLLPIGQLDGGHILFGLIGYRRHRIVSLILYIAFMFYAGLGIFHPEQINTSPDFLIIGSTIYLVFLYVAFSNTFNDKTTVLLIVVSIYAAQFSLKHIFPNIEGYAGWMLFGFLLGKVLGIYHPRTPQNQPLDWKRQLLGWLALVIFAISFSPRVLIFE